MEEIIKKMAELNKLTNDDMFIKIYPDGNFFLVPKDGFVLINMHKFNEQEILSKLDELIKEQR